MTDQDWTELGRRAVACKGWRWLPGMLMVSIQETKNLPLRLMSDGYLNRIRSQYRLFRQALEFGCPEAAQYGIDMLEAGYSWSGTDSNHVAHYLKPDAVDELRQIYLTQDGEATR